MPEPSDAVVGMLAVTQRLAGEHPDLTISQVGPGSTRRGIDASFGADMQRAELISQPITLLVLLIAFGAVVAAGVPLLLGLGSVVVALGLTAAASQHLVTVDPTAQSLILLIGLAVGVDYALFVLRRARGGTRQGRQHARLDRARRSQRGAGSHHLGVDRHGRDGRDARGRPGCSPRWPSAR